MQIDVRRDDRPEWRRRVVSNPGGQITRPLTGQKAGRQHLRQLVKSVGIRPARVNRWSIRFRQKLRPALLQTMFRTWTFQKTALV